MREMSIKLCEQWMRLKWWRLLVSEHYRDCLLAGCVQVAEDTDNSQHAQLEDELRQYFPGARTVAVPVDLHTPNDYRYSYMQSHRTILLQQRH